MDLQAITYRGRTVAAATATKFFLSPSYDDRPDGDPELNVVLHMCCYARDIFAGQLRGPYTEQDARARACLIPAELVERPELDVARAAVALQVPVDELHVARALHFATATTCRQARA